MVALSLFLLFTIILSGSLVILSTLQLVKPHIPQSLIIAFALLTFLTPSNNNFFMGLEYEDAYIFAANARFLLINPVLFHTPLQTPACVFGSLSNCEIEATYGGHFVVVPSTAYFIDRILGYDPYAICWINYGASSISAFLLYIICISITHDRTNSLVATLVYVTCPAMSLFHTSALAEPMSSLFVLVYILCFFELLITHERNYQGAMRCLMWTLLVVSFSLALLTKRENLVLLSLSLFSISSLRSKSLPQGKNLLIWTFISTTLAVLFIVEFKILRIETGESVDINAPAFSIRYVISLVPVYCNALLQFRWFGGSTILFVCGMAAMCRRSTRASGFPQLIGLFFAYIIVYTAHYRTYYFVQYDAITPFDLLRYINNTFPLFAVVTSVGTQEIRRWGVKIGVWWRGNERLVLGSAVSLWVLIAWQMANSLKKEWREIEWENRIAPVLVTVENVDPDQDYILTDLSVLFEVFGPSTVRIADSYAVGRIIPTALLEKRFEQAKTVWWLRTKEFDDKDIKRYPEFYQFIQKYEDAGCTMVPGPFSLCRLKGR